LAVFRDKGREWLLFGETAKSDSRLHGSKEKGCISEQDLAQYDAVHPTIKAAHDHIK